MELITNIQNMVIPLDQISLKGDLYIPDPAIGLVIFSHGSGSSRLSPRNQYVAQLLQKERLATLLFDLLTPEEDRDYSKRFDIDLLTKRLVAVTEWAMHNSQTNHLKMGYFGASTGAASALNAAAALSTSIGAVVSRGGRPDLAMDQLSNVVSPTLLLVGGRDIPVIELNEKAYRVLTCEKELNIVPGASHLFEEAGKLAEVARLTGEWFKKWL